MYHINYEGKVYPCRARIMKCPYGTEMHAETKEELYYKSMKVNNDVDVPGSVMSEIQITGRLRSLYALSKNIESVSYPIEIIISSLEHSIDSMSPDSPKQVDYRWKNFYKRSTTAVARALSKGMGLPDYIPEDIEKEAKRIHYEENGGRISDYGHASRNILSLSDYQTVTDMKEDFLDYSEYKKWKVTDDNYEGTLGWQKEDFYQFSHDLNTSKMITQPVFYGDLNKAKSTIRDMDDFELLAAYDDYLVSDSEIIENVKLANDFNYEYRRDLTPEANKSVEKWYNRNKKLFKYWQSNTPKRILLSVEMANELDRRKLYRQDNAIGRK